MKREVILEVANAVSEIATGGAQVSRDPCSSGPDGYPWADSPTKTLAECLSDADDATYWYTWPAKAAASVATLLASFQTPPTLVLFEKVKLQAWFSYQQQGPNSWYFPPDNAHGPRLRLVVRNRAGSSNLYSSYREIAVPADNAANENVNTHIGYTGPIPLEWETTSHPEGGPWTLDDLSVAKFAAGIEVTGDNPCFDTSSGSFHKVRIHKLRVVLGVEDLGGYVRNVRHDSSLILRLMRRARDKVTLKGLSRYAIGEVGSHVNLSRPQGPDDPSRKDPRGPNWGIRRLERRPGLVTKRTYYPEADRFEDEVWDLRAFACLAWAAYRIDCPWSPELQGFALIDKGGGYTHARAQDGWSPRPGDGVLMRVLADYPNLCGDGLAAQGGGDVAIALRNYDLGQAGWSTVGGAGTFTGAADASVTMVEEQGYLSAYKLTYGGGGGAGGRERSLGTLPRASGDYVHVRVVLKNTSVPTPASQFGEWYLKRSGGGLAAAQYWNEPGRAWTTTPTYNPVPSTEPCGESIADAIPCNAAGATSDPTYVVGVGRFSSNMAPVTLHGALVDVQHGGPGGGDSYGARTPLATLDATITRTADVHRLPNSATASAEVWSYERGVAMAELRPFWRAEAIPDGTVKPILQAFHAANSWDAIQFVAKTGSDDLIRFERAVSGQATFQLDCPIPGLDVNRGHVVRVWARWLGADGWTQYGPWSVEVGFAVFNAATGTLVSSGSKLGAFAYIGNVATRSYLAIGNDSAGRFADGYVRLIETRRNPIPGIETIWRL